MIMVNKRKRKRPLIECPKCHNRVFQKNIVKGICLKCGGVR